MAVTQNQAPSNGPTGQPLIIAPRMLSPATLGFVFIMSLLFLYYVFTMFLLSLSLCL